jgi:acyl CoA:acetate/3-ketoacid CoA transferase
VPFEPQQSKVVPAAEAMRLVPSGATLAVGGAGGVQEPDLLIESLVGRFRTEGEPRDIVEFHPIRCGEFEGRGTSLFAEPGLVRRMIGGSFWPVGATELVRRINANEMEAYNLPIGIMYALLEAAAAKRPGVVTTAGLETFLDPACGSPALNDISKDVYVERMTIGGEDYLFYRTVPIDVAFIRGTTADADGNLTMEEEPAVCGTLLLAQAAKVNGGRVIAQVKRVAPPGSLDPRMVRVPGILVDAVVVHPQQRQTTKVDFDPTLVGDARLAWSDVSPRPLDDTKVVIRRAFLEARPGEILAIGYGLAGYLPAIALEEGVFDLVKFTIEHGPVGGINGYACGGSTFPVSHNPDAILDAADQLRWYAGGGVDRAFLGLGEVDGEGNVNVGRFGERIPGVGGFIEMTQGIPRIVFCTVIGNRGRRKFVERVQQVCFSAARARRTNQEITYVTEKAVFRLGDSGLSLCEVAPGLDVGRDVLGQIGCSVTVADRVVPMPEACFAEAKMGLREIWGKGR